MTRVHWKEKFVSSRDGLKHATVDMSAVGKLLCHWECASRGGLIACWGRGCLIELRTPPGGADSPHACRGADGKPVNASRPQRGDAEAASVQPPVAARRAGRLIAAVGIGGGTSW